jgi:hypothetical protein
VPLFVHLAPERDARRIRRAGLTSRRVFCFPVVPSYALTHQWGRELRRRGQRAFVAVTFRIGDTEPVEVGHFGQPRQQVGAAAAAGLIRDLDDSRGYEVVVPRPVGRAELHTVRSVRRPTGWRYRPDEHGTRPCGCPVCLSPGSFGAARIRARFGHDEAPAPYPDLLADIRSADVDTVVDALSSIGWRHRGAVEDLAFLIAHPDPQVRETLAYMLPGYRGKLAKNLLARLAMDPVRAVRQAVLDPDGDDEDG